MTNEMTAEDFFRTMTGFDEIAISRAFSEDIADLRKKPFTFMRALVFVDFRRQGKHDVEAHQDALGVTVGELEDYFAEDKPEFDPEAPETDQGKDDELSF